MSLLSLLGRNIQLYDLDTFEVRTGLIVDKINWRNGSLVVRLEMPYGQEFNSPEYRNRSVHFNGLLKLDIAIITNRHKGEEYDIMNNMLPEFVNVFLASIEISDYKMIDDVSQLGHVAVCKASLIE